MSDVFYETTKPSTWQPLNKLLEKFCQAVNATGKEFSMTVSMGRFNNFDRVSLSSGGHSLQFDLANVVDTKELCVHFYEDDTKFSIQDWQKSLQVTDRKLIEGVLPALTIESGWCHGDKGYLLCVTIDDTQQHKSFQFIAHIEIPLYSNLTVTHINGDIPTIERIFVTDIISNYCKISHEIVTQSREELFSHHCQEDVSYGSLKK